MKNCLYFFYEKEYYKKFIGKELEVLITLGAGDIENFRKIIKY